jgi:hypothetical protein
MTEDARGGRSPGEPHKDGPSGQARWSAYLDWVRAELAAQVLAMSPEEQRTARVPSGWAPIELLSHGLHMEQRWFVWGFLGEHVHEPWGDWTVDEPWAEGADGRWVVPDSVSAEDLAERLSALGERTRAVLGEYPPEAVASPGGRFGQDPPTLEWICFHVLTEYARHLGHLDIVVELGQVAD